MNWKHVFLFTMYLLIFVCGFIITITLGVTKSNFDGKCPLYMEIRWFDIGSLELNYDRVGKGSTCDYVIYGPLIICILFPFIMLLLLGYIIFQSYLGNATPEKKLKPMTLLAVNCVSLILIFVAACIVSTGRRQMCNSITANYYDRSCFYGQRVEWHEPRFRTATFVRDIITGEVFLWISLIWWLFLIVPEFLALWRKRGTKSEEITVKV